MNGAKHLFVIAGIFLVSVFGSSQASMFCTLPDDAESSCCTIPSDDQSCCDPVQQIDDCACSIQDVPGIAVSLKVPVSDFAPHVGSGQTVVFLPTTRVDFAHDSSPPASAIPLFLFNRSLLI